MKKIGLLMLVTLVMMTVACDDTEATLACAADTICTEVFVTVQYSPTDDQNNPLIFDSYYSHNLDRGIIYNYNNDVSTATDQGIYLVITDMELEDIQPGGTTIRFIGEVDGEIVHEQDFVIGHDCCHVQLISGPGIQD